MNSPLVEMTHNITLPVFKHFSKEKGAERAERGTTVTL